jgi:hypothetical protein
MTKIRTTITIDENLLKNAKHHKIRISTFLHNSLQDYYTFPYNIIHIQNIEFEGAFNPIVRCPFKIVFSMLDVVLLLRIF